MNDFRNNPEYLRQRRAVIRKNHPDTGGSDAALIDALKALDKSWDRRERFRHQIIDNRPNFISEETAKRAAVASEQAVDIAENIAHRVGTLAGNVRETIRHRLPEEFLKGYLDGRRK